PVLEAGARPWSARRDGGQYGVKSSTGYIRYTVRRRFLWARAEPVGDHRQPRKESEMSWKILCLEGEWSTDLRHQASVTDVLALLARNDRVQFIHRDVRCAADIEHYLKRWAERRYQDFRIGYFALHGHAGAVGFRRRSVRLSVIGDRVGRSCTGKV